MAVHYSPSQHLLSSTGASPAARSRQRVAASPATGRRASVAPPARLRRAFPALPAVGQLRAAASEAATSATDPGRCVLLVRLFAQGSLPGRPDPPLFYSFPPALSVPR